jgi:hypothetical protein
MLKQIGNAVPPLLGRAIGVVTYRAVDHLAGKPSHAGAGSLQTVLPLAVH